MQWFDTVFLQVFGNTIGLFWCGSHWLGLRVHPSTSEERFLVSTMVCIDSIFSNTLLKAVFIRLSRSFSNRDMTRVMYLKYVYACL